MAKNHAGTPQEFMPTDDRTPRRKRRWGRALLTIALLLIPLGGIGLYFLGRPLPHEAGGPAGKAAAPPLEWGDRVERRMDAFIDGVRPKWADPVEEEFEEFVDKVGPKIGRGMKQMGIDPPGDPFKDDTGKAGEKPPIKAPPAKPGGTD